MHTLLIAMSRFLSLRQVPFLVSLTLLIGVTLLYWFFSLRHLIEMTGWISAPVIILSVLIFILVLNSFFRTSFIDPGIYPRALEDPPPADPLKVTNHIVVKIKGYEYKMNWCESCKFYRPPRCSHCSVCNNCVAEFDHHCPWVDNCVGKRNYKFFLHFLASLTVHMLIGVIVSVITIVLYRHDLTQVIVEMLLIPFIVIVLFCVVPLLGFHCGLVMKGRNTHEHVTHKFNLQKPNPFDLGVISNCVGISCGPMQPRYTNYNPLSNQIPVLERYRSINSESVTDSNFCDLNSSLLNTLESPQHNTSMDVSVVNTSIESVVDSVSINLQGVAETFENTNKQH